MQRHPSLQGLSRDHHHALVLARKLRTYAASPASAADLPSNPGDEATSDVLTRIREDFTRDVLPHFAVEERELLPLCHGREDELVTHAAQVTSDHAALRGMFGQLSRASSPSDVTTLADRLDAHVRFEERVWFPALEAALDPDTLAQLAWRLDPEPQVPITGFRADETEPAGAFIASLACGHSQHVRHRPPFRNAPWVTTPEGRASKVGSRVPCPLCRMPRLPPAAACYKETNEFDEHTVPSGLLASHTLRAGTWGQIVVLAGKLD
ncbi:MAG TPA: DUF3565 domain-containing protein, partial [Polyangia bacterium]